MGSSDTKDGEERETSPRGQESEHMWVSIEIWFHAVIEAQKEQFVGIHGSEAWWQSEQTL